MSELVKIDPKEFGLEENQVSTIEHAFLPKIQERDGYLSIYGELIKKEITPQVEKEAGEKARIEAEKKAAKAPPDKVKLQNYINSLSIEIPVCKTKEAELIAEEISAKFTAFKKWANSQIETL